MKGTHISVAIGVLAGLLFGFFYHPQTIQAVDTQLLRYEYARLEERIAKFEKMKDPGPEWKKLNAQDEKRLLEIDLELHRMRVWK